MLHQCDEGTVLSSGNAFVNVRQRRPGRWWRRHEPYCWPLALPGAPITSVDLLRRPAIALYTRRGGKSNSRPRLLQEVRQTPVGGQCR